MEEFSFWKLFLTISASIIAPIITAYLLYFINKARECKNILIVTLEMYLGMLIANRDVLSTILEKCPPGETPPPFKIYNEFDTVFSKMNLELLFEYEPELGKNILIRKIMMGALFSSEYIPKEMYSGYLETLSSIIKVLEENISTAKKIPLSRFIYSEFTKHKIF